MSSASELAARVVIRRDTYGVPHILAEDDEAAGFGLGYAQAEDHAAEMGRRYLLARGDAARWFGARFVEGDLAMKRLSNIEGARDALAQTGEGYRRWLHGFVTGVNAYVGAHRAELPAWMPSIEEADILAHGRRDAVLSALRPPRGQGRGAASPDVARGTGHGADPATGRGTGHGTDSATGRGTGSGTDYATSRGIGHETGQATDRGTDYATGHLSPAVSPTITTHGRGSAWQTGARHARTLRVGVVEEEREGFPPIAMDDDDPDAQGLAALDEGPGSNALAISGARTESGRPILLANPHLRWSALYWEAHVTVPGRINFYGSLTVGLAVLRAGFGERLGYAQTNNAPDLVDHYAVPLASSGSSSGPEAGSDAGPGASAAAGAASAVGGTGDPRFPLGAAAGAPAGTPAGAATGAATGKEFGEGAGEKPAEPGDNPGGGAGVEAGSRTGSEAGSKAGAAQPGSKVPPAGSYHFNGRTRPFTQQTVSVDVLQPDGRIETVTRTYDATELGPVVQRTATHAIVARSEGLAAWRFHEGFYDLLAARDLESFQRILSRQLIPQSNFTYADADGNIQYLWNARLPRRPRTDVDYDGVVPGDDDRYFWQGVHPLSDLPRVLNPRDGFVQNANNAPWFATVHDRLDPARYPPYAERRDLALRPQVALLELSARDKFSVEDVRRLKSTTRVLLAERVLPDLFAAADAMARTAAGRIAARAGDTSAGESAGLRLGTLSADLRQGLAILRAWDRHAASASRGAVLFVRFWTLYEQNRNQPFREPWNEARPIETPVGLADPQAALQALEKAVAAVRERHGSADVAWGDVNRFQFGDIDLPGNGAPGGYGLYRVLSFDSLPDGKGIAGRPGYGAPIAGTGDGWVMLVHFTQPITAYSVLAYGQSGTAASPHSRDQIGLFANQQWRRVWFSESDIRAHIARSYRPSTENVEPVGVERREAAKTGAAKTGTAKAGAGQAGEAAVAEAASVDTATVARGGPATATSTTTGTRHTATAVRQSLLRRTDSYVDGDPGIRLFVREVVLTSGITGSPILLVHGGGAGGLASFDLRVPGYSLAADFARAGHPVYVMNVRGWEQSTRPASLDRPADGQAPAVTFEEAARDVGAVIDWIRTRRHGAPVAVVGWGSGGHWAGAAAVGRRGDGISHVVLLNTLFAVEAPWTFADGCRDVSSLGAYRLVDGRALRQRWDASVAEASGTVTATAPAASSAATKAAAASGAAPGATAATTPARATSVPTSAASRATVPGVAGLWRDAGVADAYVEQALALDPTSELRTPASVRIPLGFVAESCAMASGRELWDAASLNVPVLAVRGERCFWSRPEDLAAMEHTLGSRGRSRFVTIPGATHHLILDRPERGRRQFIEETLRFIASPPRTSPARAASPGSAPRPRRPPA